MKHSNKLRTLSVLAFGLYAGACSDSSQGLNEALPTNAATLQAAAGGNTQTAAVNASVPVAPAIVVRDASGNSLSGITVTFAVTAGAGYVANPTATTDANGIASAGKWTLGASAGTNVVEARVGTLTPVQFTATATATAPAPTSAYFIDVRYTTTPTARQQLAVTRAVARWQSVITRDLSSIPMNAPAGSCWEDQPALNERVDDILIFVEFIEIDGAGSVLGEAGPCYVRSDNGLPVVGHLKLDAADLRQMETHGTIDDVVLHEIGHVLGIGTLWPDNGLLQGRGTDDPMFIGANAISAYRAIGGTLAAVPVENTGGEGTRDGHWRESVFGNELMTGWVSAGGNPLSALTIGSLIDLGYGATTSAATGYTFASRSNTAMKHELGREIMKRPKFKVDRGGKHTKVDLPYEG